jgi:hypothetical protein
VFEGSRLSADGFSQEPRYLCPGVTTDFQSWTWDTKPMWSGISYDDRISVPGIIATETADLLFYNGDVLGKTPEGPGIRVATLTSSPHAATPRVTTPLMRWEHVDPSPAYLSDGGLRLFHSRFQGPPGSTGLRMVDLDADLQPVDDGELLLPSPGVCNAKPVGECYFDPALLALPDGSLHLFFTDVTWAEDGAITAAIGHAVATD